MFDAMPNPNRRRLRDSVLFRLCVMGILILALLIPLAMVRGLILERESRFEQVARELSQTWGGPQTVGGPVLTVPYSWSEPNEKGVAEIYRSLYRFLPETLNVEGRVNPERRSRGIFETVIYSSDLHLSGSFRRPAVPSGLPAGAILLWDEAYVAVGIPDVRGLRSRVTLDWSGQPLPMAPGGSEEKLWRAGLRASVPGLGHDQPGTPYAFRLDLGLNGSRNLSVLPFGEQTTVTLRSGWASPKFAGAFLPETRRVDAGGFEATWKVASYGREYPQGWSLVAADAVAAEATVAASAVGVDLLIPADAYQQTERSRKYAILFLVLTFLTFFLFELFSQLRLHPVQYLLVGAALCLFYLLLLSLSEQAAFGLAYLAAAVPTVLLIGGYAASILQGWLRALLLTGVLGVLYGYLYVLLQLEDLALLLGSLGLFAILAAVMYLTRKINWYGGSKADAVPAAPLAG